MLERLTSCGAGEPVEVLRSGDDDVAPAREKTVRPVVIVAGAGPGIGTSIARTFGAEGFGVALLARNSARLSTQQAELAAAGIAAEAFIVDSRGLGGHAECCRASSHLGRSRSVIARLQRVRRAAGFG